jgi:sec-independent protein translocase protein TatC
MEAKMDEYFDFVFTSFFFITIMFQLPSFIIILKFKNIINSQVLIKYRKYLIILSLFLGAILSPPDIFSQILFAIPIFFLYEFSIFIIIFVRYYF